MRDRIIDVVKRELTEFCTEAELKINQDNFDHVAMAMDLVAENIADQILEDKTNLVYDLIAECLREDKPEGYLGNGFYPREDGIIECEYEYQANGVADLFEDCSGETWCTSYDEERMLWDIYPDGY